MFKKLNRFKSNISKAFRLARGFKKIRQNKMKAGMALALATGLALSAQSYAVSINLASQEVLEAVKGVGPSKAKSIIVEREKNGAYKDEEDLSRRVRGIGEKTVVKMKNAGLSFDGDGAQKSPKETRARRTPKKTAVSVGDDSASSVKASEKRMKD
jgi:competence ComEA-like helix-hairpin-helix protein